MSIRKITTLLAVLACFASTAIAQTTQTQATVQRVSGAATVTMPDGSSVALTKGMKVPQGATITTGADGDVYLESHTGYVSSIKADSVVAVEEISVTSENGQVKEEKTTLDLKSGNLVAMLDPKKRAVNNYQVRMAGGVAAARGTTFSVRYAGALANIVVLNGTVSVNIPSWGNAGYTVQPGQAVQNGRNVPLAQFLQTYPGEMSALVASVAVAAAGNIGGTSSADLKAVLDTVIAAAPSLAPRIASLVQTYAPSQTSVVRDSVQQNAPSQINAVNEAVRTAPTPQTTTPQVIDPSTVSRSG